jgi:Fe-S-cluster-containing dehydrogenase component
MTKQKYLVIDVDKCHDCNNCFMACEDEYVDNDWSPYQKPMPRHGHRWMDILRRERGSAMRVDMAFLPKPCFQCEDPACAKGNDFVSKREDGVVVIDVEKGKGKNITASCPYGAIWWNEEEQISQKCSFCVHLLDNTDWKEVRCSHVCPTYAMVYYDMEPSEFERLSAKEGYAAYKPELCGKGHVYYKNLHKFTKNFVAGQLLKDGDVAKGVEVTLTGAAVDAVLKSDFFGEFKFDGLEDGEYTLSASGKELGKVKVAGASVNAGEFTLA